MLFFILLRKNFYLRIEMKTYTYGQIWKIAFPVLISLLMEQLVGMTDTAFLGRVGEVELGASALGSIFYIAVFVLGMGLGTGAQILMGRRNGEGLFHEVGNFFYHSLFLLLLVATILFTIVRNFSPWLLAQMISSQDVYAAACEYVEWRVYGFFFAYIAIMFRAFYVATTQTKTLTLNSVMMVASNILFNYVLIFGKFGFPALGIAGAAIGSVMAECVSMLFFIFYTRFRLDYHKYGLHLKPHFRHHFLRKILSISIWTMVQNFLSLGTWFLFFLAVEHLGERELAVSNIIRNISSLLYMTLSAMASTVSTLVSNLMGQDENDAVLPMVSRALKLSAYIIFPMAALIAIFPEWVLAIYTDETELIVVGVAPLFVLLSSYLFTVPQRIYLSATMGSGNTRRALWIEVVSLAIYSLFIYVVIFHDKAPLWVCWFSEYVYSIPAMLLAWIYMRSNKWRSRKI